MRNDLEFITEGTDDFGIFGLFGGAIDLPPSLVGDIVTLPWTIRAARARKASGIQP